MRKVQSVPCFNKYHYPSSTMRIKEGAVHIHECPNCGTVSEIRDVTESHDPRSRNEKLELPHDVG